MNADPIKVLLVEDDPNDVQFIQMALAGIDFGQIDCRAVNELSKAVQLLNQEAFDLILLDLSLNDAWGLDTIIQLNAQAVDIPVVILTGNDDENIALEAVKLGAQDYLVKGQVSDAVIVRTIRHAIERHHLLKDLEKQITALLHSEVRFHKMIEHNADAIVIIDHNNTIRFVNPAAENLFGSPAEYLIDKQFMYPIVVDEATEISLSNTKTDNILAFAEMRVVEMLWEEKPAYLASLRDITVRKQAERSLREYTQELQARNEELDAFAHSVAHDLRNPLTLIVGFAKMLEEEYHTLSAAEIQKTVRTIAFTGQKMSHIVDGLLVLAGLRNQSIKQEPLDMAAIVQEVRHQLQPLIETHQPKFIMPGQWPVVIGYRPWIEQVWTNYMSNAIKYGGESPEIELGAQVQSNGMACFWVSDNGPGLSYEDQKRLFKPFMRLESSTNSEGHGLGLSIVKRIIERLGGEVGVKSSGITGQGSQFFFTLSLQD
ncbi:MAG: response regulator [Anaerolineae bacterium]|nr:response regulator [Anaerolineae bacterium]